MTFFIPLVLLFFLTVVSHYDANDTTSGVKVECAKEMSERVVDKQLSCCSDFMSCSCIKALCKTDEFHSENDCLDDSLYKSCNDNYQKNCSSLTDSNFANKCTGMDKDQWGRVKPKSSNSLVIAYLFAAFLVLFLGIAFAAVAVQRFSSPESSKKSSENGTVLVKRKSHSNGSKRKTNSFKRKSGVAHDKSKSKSKSKAKVKIRIKEKVAVSKVKSTSLGNPKSESQSEAGSFDSRAFFTRKVTGKGKANKGRVAKLTYTKLKKALM